MADEKNLDRTFAETQNIEVYADKKMFRYRKRYKKQTEGNGRKQGRFHQKDKDRTAGIRRD